MIPEAVPVPTIGNVVPFPRAGFIIGDHNCRQPGPERHLMCFGQAGHSGDHTWSDWRGCRMRTPYGVIPFGGFAE